MTHRQLVRAKRGQRASHGVAGQIHSPPVFLGFAAGRAAAVDALADDLIEYVQHARLHRLVRLHMKVYSRR